MDRFAEAYSRRNSGKASQLGGAAGVDNFTPNDGYSKPMTDRFIQYMNDGLANEK